jgi:CubicO group peptidase (beta-lactamase class C family)
MAAIKPLFVHQPGAAWKYSNTGYVLLGVIAERAGGAPLPALIEQQVAAPAGLRETAWDSDPDRAPGRAMGYGFSNGGEKCSISFGWVRAPVVSTSYVGASGAIPRLGIFANGTMGSEPPPHPGSRAATSSRRSNQQRCRQLLSLGQALLRIPPAGWSQYQSEGSRRDASD